MLKEKRDWVAYYTTIRGSERAALVIQNKTSLEAWEEASKLQNQDGRGLLDETLPIFTGKELDLMSL